ncbi:MAG: hypothetical protein HY273_06065 [Gammaproteobacteria bacterium]|nr:hypothetical protein [Gammaproteobacteria bacterium]
MKVWRWGLAATGVASLMACVGSTQYRFDENDSDLFTASPASPVQLFAKPKDQVQAPTLASLINSQHYADAIELIERDIRAHDTPETRQQLAQVTKLADYYDKVVGADIEDAVSKQDWNTVYRLLDQATALYPQGAAVREWRSALAAHRQVRADDLKVSLLMERAAWLLQSRTVLEELVNLEPRNTVATGKLDEVRSEAQSLAMRLSKIGIAALTNKDLELAERCLTLADRLHPIAENILALERLDRAQLEVTQEKRKQRLREEQEQARRDAEKRKQSLHAVEERQQQQSRHMVDDINATLAKGDLLRAQAMLEQLRGADKNNSQIPVLEQTLAGAIAARVDELLEKGNTLYSNGDIEQAKTVWEEALLLNPGSTRARARVARAQQVLSNLREQQQKKASN